jgi:hypothetical protein
VKKKLLDYPGKLKENAVYVGLVITLIVLYCFDYINTEEKITWTSISSGLIAIIVLQCQFMQGINRACACGVRCQGASFRGVRCQGAIFEDAQCQGADFWNAQCQGAYFGYVQCQGADFRDAQCQGASFEGAQLAKSCAYKLCL